MALSASPLALKSCLDQASNKTLLEPIRNSAPPEQSMASIAQMWREDNAKSAVSNRTLNSAISKASKTSVSTSIQQTPAMLYPSVPSKHLPVVEVAKATEPEVTEEKAAAEENVSLKESLNVQAPTFIPSSIPIRINGSLILDRRGSNASMDEFAKGNYGSPAELPKPGIDRPIHPLPAKPVLCALPPSEPKLEALMMADRVGGTMPFRLGAPQPPPGDAPYGDMSLPSMMMWTRRSSTASARMPIQADGARRPSEDFAAKFAAFSFNNDTFPAPAVSESDSIAPQDFDRSQRRPSHGLLLGAVPMQSQVYQGERRPSQVYLDLGTGQQVDSSWRRNSDNFVAR